jgi:hypothetical protein
MLKLVRLRRASWRPRELNAGMRRLDGMTLMLFMKRCACDGLRVMCLAAVVGVALNPLPAKAHGPCRCLSLDEAPPGTVIKIPASYGAVEVLWNPNPQELSNPALVGSRWARFFHPDRRTTSVARQPEPGAIRFSVPRVPDGKYLVVIFDLSEGGPRNHYTWNTFTVRRGARLPATGLDSFPILATSIIMFSVGALLLLMSSNCKSPDHECVRGTD